MSYARPHHQRISEILKALNSQMLSDHHCLFGGGTAIALKYDEYRESVDVDFLVSDIAGYRGLRNVVRQPGGIKAIMKNGAADNFNFSEVRSDQYGIRSKIYVDGLPIKFEIVLEGRIALACPKNKDNILGVATLTALDMATSKLLANSDRGMDIGVHCRDIIDLAMMCCTKSQLSKAVGKAEAAYGVAILKDLEEVINLIRKRDGWLEECMTTMDVSVPRSVLWHNISKLEAMALG